MEGATLFVHIAAGSIAMLAGYIAIFATKGAALHRHSGAVFACAMIVMGITATIVAALRGIEGSLIGGPLAAYFVVTALTAVRPIDRRLDIAMPFVALTISAFCCSTAVSALLQGRATLADPQIPASFLLASVSLLAAVSDMRLLRGPALQGTRRVARHLWRMCFAFWIAAGSFFLGQMDAFPAWLQNAKLMAIPAFLPLVLMCYWLWRIHGRRLLAGMVLRRA